MFLLLAKRLVVKVQKLLAVESFEATQDTLTNTTNSDGTDNLVLKIIFLLGDSGDIPVTSFNLFVSRDKVSDQDKDSHDDVFSNGDDIAASDLGDSETAIGLVSSIEVDVVRANASSDAELQVLGLGESLSGQVTRVEAVPQLEC